MLFGCVGLCGGIRSFRVQCAVWNLFLSFVAVDRANALNFNVFLAPVNVLLDGLCAECLRCCPKGPGDVPQANPHLSRDPETESSDTLLACGHVVYESKYCLFV